MKQICTVAGVETSWQRSCGDQNALVHKGCEGGHLGPGLHLYLLHSGGVLYSSSLLGISTTSINRNMCIYCVEHWCCHIMACHMFFYEELRYCWAAVSIAAQTSMCAIACAVSVGHSCCVCIHALSYSLSG